MSGYRDFAVVGAGRIGEFIVDELLKLKASGTVSSVVVVSRSDASTPEWISKGAKFAIIDYDSPSTITSAFTNIDVVISTVGAIAVPKQADLAVGAKSAAVKLFVPSEFGTQTDNVKEGVFYPKRQVQDKLKEVRLPYCLFFTGGFTDLVFRSTLGWDLENGKADIGGEGKALASLTSRPDIARYLAYVLTTLPTSNLDWRIFRIEGDRISLNDIASGYQKKTGKTLDVTYTPRRVLEERVAKNPYDFSSILRLVWDQGGVLVGEVTDNKEWPDWNPKKVLDVIA